MSKELSSDESCDEESICSRKVHQRKIGPGLWADVPIEKVASVPEDINGLRVYEIEEVFKRTGVVLRQRWKELEKGFRNSMEGIWKRALLRLQGILPL